MSPRRIAVFLAVVLIAAQSAGAQQPEVPTDPLTLPALLRLVNERSPRLAAERVAIDAAQADRAVADLLPNPTVSVGRFKPSAGMHTLFDGASQQQVNVDIPLLVGNQRGARVDAADQAVLAARARVGLAGSDLAVRAAELFVGLQAAQEKVVVVEAGLAELRRLAGIVAGRLDAGVASRYELARVEVELAGLATKLDEARVERSTRAAGLAALVGAAGWRPVAAGTPQPKGLPAEGAIWRERLVEGNAQLQSARRDEDAAQAAVRRAERERAIVPVLSLGRTWTSDPFGAANFVGLSAEIPLLDKRLGPVAKAAAELRAARLRREAVESEVEADLQRLLETLAQRKAALEQFDRNVGRRMSTLKDMAEDAYQLGRGSILELIDAARGRLDAALTGIELRAAAVDQESRLLALAGKLGE